MTKLPFIDNEDNRLNYRANDIVVLKGNETTLLSLLFWKSYLFVMVSFMMKIKVRTIYLILTMLKSSFRLTFSGELLFLALFFCGKKVKNCLSNWNYSRSKGRRQRIMTFNCEDQNRESEITCWRKPR